MMVRKATISEKIRGWVHKLAYVVVAIPSVLISLGLCWRGLMNVLIENASTLAVTGAAISAFLFTIQSTLFSVPKDNPFMQHVRKDGRYLILIHRFCRTAEIAFMLLMLPMFYMSKCRVILNLVVVSIYISAILLTVWAMYLMGQILIICERSAS